MASNYAPLMQFGLGIAQSAIKANLQSSLNKAQRTVDKANADAANLLREGQNEVSAARSALTNAAKEINNRRVLRAGGEQINRLSTNYYRALDQATKGSIQQQLQASEQIGRMAAVNGWSGTGGTSSQLVEDTLRRQAAFQKQDRETIQRQQRADHITARSDAQLALTQSFDQRYDLAGIDYGQTQAPFRPDGQSTLGAAFTGADFSLLRDGLEAIRNKPGSKGAPDAKALGFSHSTTGVSSPADFSASVSRDFFSLNTGANLNI